MAEWKHRALSYVEQEGVQPMPKDRGAEQGDVDGPLECSRALRMVAAEARESIAVQQAARTLSWIDTDSLHERRLRDEQRNRMQRIQHFLLSGPEKTIVADAIWLKAQGCEPLELKLLA